MTKDGSTDKDRPLEKDTADGAEEELSEGDTSAETDQSTRGENRNSTQSHAAEESAAEVEEPIQSQPDHSTVDENNSDEIQSVEDFDVNLLLDIPLEITVELGRTRVRIQQLLEFGPGSTVTLSKLEGEPVDILANDKLIARGEVVLQNKKYGIRITEITSRMNRIKSLH
jgi:flagellar motor switch protein FliN/FliY